MKFKKTLLACIFASGIALSACGTKQQSDVPNDSDTAPQKQDFGYMLSFDDEYYSVWIEGLESNEVLVPSAYNGKPVKELIFSSKDYSKYKKITIPNSIERVLFPSNYNSSISFDSVNYLGTVDEWIDMDRTDGTIAAFTNQMLVNGEKITSLNLNKNITNLAFFGFKDLTNVTFDENVKIIENSAFSYTGIERLEIPTTVEQLKNGSLAYMSSLKELTLPLTAIEDYNTTNWVVINSILRQILGYNDVDNATLIEKITFSDGEEFSSYLFRDEYLLKEIAFSEGLKSIPDRAFAGSNAPDLEILNIPSTVKKLGKSIINNGNKKLTAVNFAGTKEQWNSISKDDGQPNSWCGGNNQYYKAPINVVHCSDGDVAI